MKLRFFFQGFYAELAEWHATGAGNLPERPHLSKFLKENRKRLFINYFEKNKKQFLEDESGFLKALGAIIIAEYKAWVIAGNVTPALKDTTIQTKTRKGYQAPSSPLFASGDMINALLCEVF